jgi:hypothetical protein
MSLKDEHTLKKNFLTCFSFAVLGLLSHPLHAAMKTFIYANESYDRVHGFIQTPQGGSIGTTSLGRPTFDELNIHHDHFYALGAAVQFDDYFALFDYHHFSPHGSTILNQSLMTHAKFIPVGSSFEMSMDYDLFTIGFGKHFHFSNHWTVSPALLANLLNYHYEFYSPPLSSARSFSLVGVDLGVKVQYDFTKKFAVDFMGAISLPVSNTDLYAADLGLSYRLRPSHHVHIIPRIALGYFQLDYKDEQTIPNHICYTGFPTVSFGVIVEMK